MQPAAASVDSIPKHAALSTSKREDAPTAGTGEAVVVEATAARTLDAWTKVGRPTAAASCVYVFVCACVCM